MGDTGEICRGEERITELMCKVLQGSVHAYAPRVPGPHLAHISPTSRPYLAHISQVQAMSTTHSIRAIRRNYWWET